MNKIKIFFLVVCFPFVVKAQEANKGIKWVNGLSWEQVKQKAKRENKYIFLDCYATWCGPCKEMDKYVFVNDSVGDYFNDKFISAKVQLDQTKNDNDEIKKWYEDARALNKEFDIQSVPSFLFFNSNGVATNLETGYMSAQEFIKIAQISLQPGKTYEPRPIIFRNFANEYRHGNVNYDKLPSMIQLAERFDTVLRRGLMFSYKQYVGKLGLNERYTRENIEFWASLNLSSKSQFYQYFVKDSKRIDQVMSYEGYSAEIIDKVIFEEIVVPFLIAENKNPNIPMVGMYLHNPQPDTSEANFKKLESLILRKFNYATAKRIVIAARVEWYARMSNSPAFAKYFLMQLDRYPPRINDKICGRINDAAWNAFIYISDKELLNGYINWMSKVVSFSQKGNQLDTYANLLYKVGRKQEAIQWEEKAILTDDRGAELFKLTLEQMKSGQPTYNTPPLVEYKN